MFRSVLALGVLFFPLISPTFPIVGGSPHRTDNLLRNAGVSTGSLASWSQTGGVWAVQNGPVGLASVTMDSCDHTSWFFESGQTPGAKRTISISQVVNFPPNYFTTQITGIEYGGDAFAGGAPTYNPLPNAAASAGVQAKFTVFYADATGATLGMDSSGAIFVPSGVGCSLPSGIRTNCSYRRTTGQIPSQTRSIRFVGEITNTFTTCYTSGHGQFVNGFDNLFLAVWYRGPATYHNP